MSYTFDQMAGLDQLMSGIGQYGTFSNIPTDYFSPQYWDPGMFSSVQGAPVEDRSSWANLQNQQSGDSSGLFGGLSASIGDMGLKDWLTLGTGALGAYGAYQNYKSNRDIADATRRQMEADTSMKEAQYGDEFAKMHALAQIMQERQGINLDPSLAYAQALRRKYGGSPDNANDFPGVDVGGPMRVGMSSEDRLNAINEATGVNFRNGGLGLLRGGTSGQADAINARLSDGEYVVDSDVVSALGDGNTEAGARRLDQMREQIRRHKRSASSKSIPPAAKDPMKYMKG